MESESKVSFDELREQAEAQEAQGVDSAGPAFELYDLDDYAGEVETHWVTPDKSQPKKKIRLDVRMQALTGRQINLIHRKALRAQNAVTEANYLQQRLNQHVTPREVFKLRQQLADVNDIDFDTPEKAEERRDSIQKQIDGGLAAWQAEHDRMQAELERLLSWPTFYQVLCEEYFGVAIEDHTIAWRGQKVDFKKPSQETEPPDRFVAWLKETLDGILQRGKAKRSGGSLRKQ